MITVKPIPEGERTDWLPAWCTKCGLPWETQFAVDGDGSFSEMTIGPCPRCGGDGVVSDGYLKMTQFAAKTLRGLDRSQLEGLQSELRSMRGTGVSQAELANRLTTTDPALAPVAMWLSNQNNRMEVGMWISAVIALIALIIAARSPAPISERQIEQMVRSVVEQTTGSTASPGRNQTCPCWSGLKWKHCHGSPVVRSMPSTPPGPA
ncbi:SEC-C metal-binding domain-containing protein [Klenkia terrae]|uniref:SEC-C domain-containing protein n=1 Tax=Klenkia terrae TaxID=1052259 RepID=A0ABU8E283_9ACTN|nr:SEC-C domain-containing protein [Klenkia terrae]SSC21616.1 Hypothetical protein KLENKIAIHU_185 [Klenkia terrae]